MTLSSPFPIGKKKRRRGERKEAFSSVPASGAHESK
jgi:hypothetical protein